MPPSFPLVTAPWIGVWDLDAAASRSVGLLEALTRAHRLVLPVDRSEAVVVLRLLAAVLDAACGPRETAEWDAAWRSPALDADAVTAYLDRYADRLDLFHPEHPAFQSGQLTEYARGPEALHPGSLAGEAGQWFNEELRGPLAPLPAERAAPWLLHLLAYDVAGIKRAAPGDPAGRAGKLYGAQLGPLASATHLHLTGPGLSLKDVLLLNLPPQPRATGDAPVWERGTPDLPVRTRAATGRLDLLTWPNRRVRLHATDEGLVDAVAHHDGDRLDDTWPTVQRLDPMTAWGTGSTGALVPLRFLNAQSWPQSWRAAEHLDQPGTCRAVDHAAAAAERGTLNAGQIVQAVVSTTVYSNLHKTTISDIPVAVMPLAAAGLLADPDAREGIAAMARYADILGGRLRKHAMQVSHRSSDQVAPRMLLTDVDRDWEAAVRGYGDDPEAARAGWEAALHREAERRIEEFPLRESERRQLLAIYATSLSQRPARAKRSSSRQTAPAKKRGPVADRHEVFGRSYTLSELSRHPECVVSYATLRKRVAEGWDVKEAATTPGRRGPATT
ncbi:type I-E CRISPR-associated protein Cse1/CasA [Streptomyces olivaceoviridis]|uniref:type I-E CRISPR-associated protein Cse1/CasA n=1 Tax=Streptomyces olivaceoviridis TaxID=1921 RepID=UPI00331846B5